MSKYNFVTSFNETIYKNIGHHLIKSIDNQFEPALNLTCYYHDCNIDSYKLIKKDSISIWGLLTAIA